MSVWGRFVASPRRLTSPWPVLSSCVEVEVVSGMRKRAEPGASGSAARWSRVTFLRSLCLARCVPRCLLTSRFPGPAPPSHSLPWPQSEPQSGSGHSSVNFESLRSFRKSHSFPSHSPDEEPFPLSSQDGFSASCFFPASQASLLSRRQSSPPQREAGGRRGQGNVVRVPGCRTPFSNACRWMLLGGPLLQSPLRFADEPM